MESSGPVTLISAFRKSMDAEPHTPVYLMHKYFARRPWNVFNELISDHSNPGDIVLDPFCGGGVTVVESLKLRRKAVGIDLNPVAAYITTMEVKPADLQEAKLAFDEVSRRVRHRIYKLYSTKCPNCGKTAVADWIEWNESKKKITRLKFHCAACGETGGKPATEEDQNLAEKIEKSFSRTAKRGNLWYPKTRIPLGDKTSSLLNQNINFFQELFTRRNLVALSMLLKDIEALKGKNARDLLRFPFSSSLKWASRQSHLRGKIVEGWAMHAYWIYPRSLEINVWDTFSRRFQALVRGKKYGNEHFSAFARSAGNFENLANGNGSYLILSQSAGQMPMPDNSIDAVITDPPYGGNVNYGELSDFWYVWLSGGKTIEKRKEVIVNRTQSKSLEDYERLLYEVFKECYRVLKPGRNLVSTFNSKDIRVVGSFITAASRAGFSLRPDGVAYQKPIRSYTTTFHAMQIGAFVGDFVFNFTKDPERRSSRSAVSDLEELKSTLSVLIEGSAKDGAVEPDLREGAYRLLIPFLAEHAPNDIQACREAAAFFEMKMRELEPYFRQLRKTIIEKRRRKFGTQQLS